VPHLPPQFQKRLVTVQSKLHDRIRVWDVPTRLAHWAVVVLFGLCWWTAEADHMEWHCLAGSCLLGVVLFRLGWGFVGSDTARFFHFVHSPSVVVAYARKVFVTDPMATSNVGHNPMGGWSVLAMLGLLLMQASLGLITVDVDAIASGPLAKWVSFDTGRLAAHWHANTFYALLGLIGFHLAAISFYGLVRRQNLLPSMFHGFTVARPPPVALYFAPLWRALVLAVLTAVVVTMLANAW
jgi:cytochrome b